VGWTAGRVWGECVTRCEVVRSLFLGSGGWGVWRPPVVSLVRDTVAPFFAAASFFAAAPCPWPGFLTFPCQCFRYHSRVSERSSAKLCNHRFCQPWPHLQGAGHSPGMPAGQNSGPMSGMRPGGPRRGPEQGTEQVDLRDNPIGSIIMIWIGMGSAGGGWLSQGAHCASAGPLPHASYTSSTTSRKQNLYRTCAPNDTCTYSGEGDTCCPEHPPVPIPWFGTGLAPRPPVPTRPRIRNWGIRWIRNWW